MEIQYTKLTFPEIKDKLSGPEYEVLKADIATLMMGQRLETFEAQASVDGPWAPLKDVDGKLKTVRKDYAKELEEMRSGKRDSFSKRAEKMRAKDKILVRTGILRASFTGSGTGIEIQEDEITIFTNVEYAAPLNFGAPKKNIPARPFDQFTEQNEKEIAEMLQGYLDG
jgi:phage gpG-like protein